MHGTALVNSTSVIHGASVEELVLRWQRDGDAAARETLVEQFLPLARKLARRYGRSSMPIEDLVQVASLGLIKAIDRFDVERGGTLSSFAIPTILGELRRHFRDTGWSVHVPRGAQERALRVRDASERLERDTGRPPTVNQLAEFLELDVEEVLDALQAFNGYEPTSLDTPRVPEEGAAGTLAEMFGAEDEGYELAEDLTVLGDALARLPEREREILRMRFAEELTQSQIASRTGISQMQVSRL
ncbi:MAG: polymerase, sigma 28 subunit, Sig subfamily, partial [Solirubrobacterales bacterium]|nr:polymerase, sigma 28 subunit, Sig subfamily [Solirubrobacterales bacterium]